MDKQDSSHLLLDALQAMPEMYMTGTCAFGLKHNDVDFFCLQEIFDELPYKTVKHFREGAEKYGRSLKNIQLFRFKVEGLLDIDVIVFDNQLMVDAMMFATRWMKNMCQTEQMFARIMTENRSLRHNIFDSIYNEYLRENK